MLPRQDFPIQKNKILCQCRKDADVLLDNFRNDVSCEVLEKFKKRGVNLKQLKEFQKQVPVIYPWDEDYDKLRYIVNRRFISFPWMIAMCETTEDVVKCVNWARENHIPIAVRSGSHCFEPFSLVDGMIIDQSRRTKIKIVEDKYAELESGCLIGPTQLELSKVNLALVGGTCVNTGVAGLTLGGGIGFLERKFGLACDNLLEVEIVLANGDVVKANHSRNEDLFWALRGAGNENFGIVTKFVFRVHHIPKVAIFDFTYPYEMLQELIKVWQRWAPRTNPNLTSELDVYSDRVLITGQFLGSTEDLKTLLKPLSRFPTKDWMIEEVPFIDAVRHFAGRGRWLPFFENHSGFVAEPLPEEALDIIAKYMRFGGPEDHVELDAFGGKVSAIPSDATAFPHRKVLYWCHLQAHWAKQPQTPEKLKWIRSFYEELKPYLTGAYVNAPDITLEHPLEEYYGKNLPRLREIKTKYDPENFFRYAQSIPPYTK